MTEELWQRSTEVRELLEYLCAERHLFERKLQLLCCRFCQRKSQHLRVPEIKHLLSQAESLVEGRLSKIELREIRWQVLSRSSFRWNYGYDPDDPISAACYAVLEFAAWLVRGISGDDELYDFYEDHVSDDWRDVDGFPYPIRIARIIADAMDSDVERQEGWSYERDQQLLLVRCIFGNPFRPVMLDPRWLSSTVLDLARTIYDERVFERMPILADALMDAGCDSDEIINHCRGTGPHVRGCWVVDLILGKE